MYSRAILLVGLLIRHTWAFTPSNQLNKHAYIQSTAALKSLSENEKSFVLTEEQVGPVFKVKIGSKGSEKIINIFGAFTVLLTVVTGIIWSLAMTITEALDNDPDSDRAAYDYTGKLWSRLFMTVTNSYPEINGLENIDAAVSQSLPVEGNDSKKQGILYVANHCSWLDIQLLCCAIDPVFKFIAKGDLAGVPLIGQQLRGGKHVLIDREDRRSQLRTFKECINWLKIGVSIMAFPEGQRSPNGRLLEFKGGSFSMAGKTGAIIVPITLTNAHSVMPMNAIFPVQTGAGKLRVILHPPIDPAGKSDEELTSLVRNAIISKLPSEQVPLSEFSEEKEAILQ